MTNSSLPFKPAQSGLTDVPGEDGIGFHEMFLRLYRGINQTLGFALLGLAIAAVGYILISPYRTVSTSVRVIFSFPGFDHSEYPDHSKFQPDDLRAPEIIAEALKKQGLVLLDDDASRIRGALIIEGILPQDVIKQRDRMRSLGQVPPPFLPDEYSVTLVLPAKFPLTPAQRERLLVEILSVFQDRFQRTFARLPVEFGNVQESLQAADLPDYVTIWEQELANINAYLAQLSEKAKAFRSVTTNLSFGDLIKKTQYFQDIQLNEIIGFIRVNGLSRNKERSLTKMDYAILTLKDQERLALEEEKVTKEFLEKAQDRAQNFVMGIKSQAPQQHSDTPVLDQGLVDSLLANDAYNFTLRKALDAGLQVRRIQSEIAKVQVRRKELEGTSDTPADKTAAIKAVENSLQVLYVAYDRLIENIRQTQADFARQQYGNAVRVSDQIRTADGSLARALIVPSVMGAIIGAALGMGLSLLGLSVLSKKRS